MELSVIQEHDILTPASLFEGSVEYFNSVFVRDHIPLDGKQEKLIDVHKTVLFEY